METAVTAEIATAIPAATWKTLRSSHTPDDDGSVREMGSPTGRLADLRSFDPVTGIPTMSAIPVSVARAENL